MRNPWRSPLRPSTQKGLTLLVVRIARENDTWGYPRIRDVINNLGHKLSRDTGTNILKDHGIDPAPQRGPRTTWASFLKQHWAVPAATDFCTVVALTPRGIIRYQVLFVIRLATREVHIACISGNGAGALDGTSRSQSDRLPG